GPNGAGQPGAGPGSQYPQGASHQSGCGSDVRPRMWGRSAEMRSSMATNQKSKVKHQESPRVALLMGSDSDLPTVKEACEVLSNFGVSFVPRVLSAHRTPEDLVAFVKQAEQEGVQVFIAAAGGAAHLAGVVAAHTTRPVLGIPIQTSSLSGLDSL